jgi:hypothetical protein
MPRTKGSKNKAGLKQGYAEGLRIHISKVLEKELIKKSEELSVKSGIPLREVLNDAVAEGLTCLETDAYKSLILFRSRRGKVIYERELVGTGSESQEPNGEKDSIIEEEISGGLPFEPAPEGNSGRYTDALVERGHRPEDIESSLVHTGIPGREESVTAPEAVPQEQNEQPKTESNPEGDDLHIPF